MYNQTHQTKDGKIMMIAEMSDDHLKNTVDGLISKLSIAKRAINTIDKISNFEKVIFGYNSSLSEKQAQKTIDNIMSSLPFYIFECTIREINYGPKLREVLERNPNVIKNPFQLFHELQTKHEDKNEIDLITDAEEDYPF